MSRSSPALAAAAVVALLVVLAPTAAAPAVDASSATAAEATTADATAARISPQDRVGRVADPTPTNNTSARLELADFRVEQAAFATVTVGLGSTLQTAAFDAREEHRRIAIEQEFEAADDVGEQRSVVDRALIGLNSRVQRLEARERATLRQYADGNISTATFVRRLARIDARARELKNTLALVRQLTDRIGTDDFDARIRDTGGLLAPLTGPVRHRVARALSGDTTSVRVHVVAADDGVVLATLSRGRYVREATDWRSRNVSAPAELEFGDFGEIGSRVEELYPWVTAQTRNPSFEWRGSGAWQFQASHDQGKLTALIDASTTDVYREVQKLSVTEMPATMTLVRIRGGLRIVLQRTYPGGPVRILVEDAATDAVVNADVTVGGHELGRIGSDGVVVTLEPRLPYTVNVTGSDTSVVLDVERPLNASG